MFNKFSMTHGGILVAVVGTLLAQANFSESCVNEIFTNVPLVLGGVMAWIGRARVGDVSLLGMKKY